MNKQKVLIFKLPELFNILNEFKNYLDFQIYSFSEKNMLSHNIQSSTLSSRVKALLNA